MRAVVTGGAGFIGSHLVDALLARGDEVHVVDDLSSGRRDQVPEEAGFSQLDIRGMVRDVENRSTAILRWSRNMRLIRKAIDDGLNSLLSFDRVRGRLRRSLPTPPTTRRAPR